jgi:acetylglutamate kinase
MGLPNSPMANADIRVASGNFVTARPRGVVEGVDMLYTGEVRKVNADAITPAWTTANWCCSPARLLTHRARSLI